MPTQVSHLRRDMENLKRNLLFVGKLALSELSKAVDAFDKRDVSLAQVVAESDKDLDQHEVHVEEECLRIIALNQPVAQDLRYLISVIKINGLIENTGDTAVQISRRATFLATRPPLPIDLDIAAIGARVIEMFDRALQAFVNLDELEAHHVIEMDAEVDRGYRANTNKLIALMEQHSDMVEVALQTMHLVRHLERAADRATDIAQQVLYILTGDIVRHRNN